MFGLKLWGSFNTGTIPEAPTAMFASLEEALLVGISMGPKA